jgi:hypothetical protein
MSSASLLEGSPAYLKPLSSGSVVIPNGQQVPAAQPADANITADSIVLFTTPQDGNLTYSCSIVPTTGLFVRISANATADRKVNWWVLKY